MGSDTTGSGGNLAFAAEASRRFADYWFSLPRDGLLPARSAFDPCALRELLTLLMVREILPDGSARCRLAGTGIRELFGRELTGHSAGMVLPTGRWQHEHEVGRALLGRPCGLGATLRMATGQGRELLFESVSFPFARLPSGNGYTIGHFAPLDGTWLNGHDPVRSAQAEALRFIDIGAGVPALDALR